ncbi:MAG TPA: hypothetical protein VGG75_15990 [Trebonia sp.]
MTGGIPLGSTYRDQLSDETRARYDEVIDRAAEIYAQALLDLAEQEQAEEPVL